MYSRCLLNGYVVLVSHTHHLTPPPLRCCLFAALAHVLMESVRAARSRGGLRSARTTICPILRCSLTPPQADIPSVKGLLVLDGEGKRIVARYYSTHFASSADELAFEKKLFDKTARTNAKTEGAHFWSSLFSRALQRSHQTHPLLCAPAAEIIILDGLITVYKNSADVWLYVVRA